MESGHVAAPGDGGWQVASGNVVSGVGGALLVQGQCVGIALGGYVG